MSLRIPTYDRLRGDRGHRAYVRSVGVVSGHEPRALTVGFDGTLRVHALDPLRPLVALHAHAQGAGALAVSPVAPIAATGGGDGYVRIWRVDGELRVVEEHRLPLRDASPVIETLCISPDGQSVVVGAVGGSLWRVEIGGRVRRVDERLISVNAIKFSPCGGVVMVGSDERVIRFYRVEGGELAYWKRSVELDDHVDALDVQPIPGSDGFRVAATTHGNRIWMLDQLPASTIVRSAPVGRSALNAAVFLGDRVVVGGDDHVVYVVDVATLEARAVVDVVRDIDALAVVSPEEVLAATTGGLFRVAITRRQIVASSQNRGALAAVVTDGERVYAGHHDEPYISVGRWTDAAGETLRRLVVPAPVNCAALEARVFGLADGHVIEVDSQLEVRSLAKAPAEVEAVCVARDRDGGRVVIAVDRSGTMTFIDARGGVSQRVCAARARLKAALPVQLEGATWILVAGKDHHVYACSLPASGASSAVIDLGSPGDAARTFNGICVGPEDVVYLACWDGRVHRVRLGAGLRAGPVLPPLDAHTHAVEGILWTAGRLVTTSYDGTCRIWSRAWEHAPPAPSVISISDLAVRRICPSARSGHVLTAGYDGNVVEIDLDSASVRRAWQVTPERSGGTAS